MPDSERPAPSADLPPPAGAELTVDTGRIVANWRTVAATAGVPAAAVVKADGYGLGAAPVAAALAAAGCRLFFVATLGEAVALRQSLPGPEIAVLGGLVAGAEPHLLAHRLTPVLNQRAEFARWRDAGDGRPAILHVDTGLNRLGLPMAELDAAAEAGLAWRAVISHMVAAEDPAHPMNATQLMRFRAVTARLPGVPASLAASSGSFLGPDYAFDFVRPGAALYGVNPQPGRPNPLLCPLRLDARILQVRELAAGDSVGYGATFVARRPSRIATIPVGYADGFLRAGSSRAVLYLSGHPVPVVGRVSMDLITLDVTDLPPGLAVPGAAVEILGPARPPDQAGPELGSMAYEVLTSLGRRFPRRYRELA